ncbi:MAG: glycoside hydrolase family 10 protein, partial [Anaerotignaceae bacterium]
DKYQELGLNTVIVQVRPKGDALYNSAINPWSSVLTGTEDKNPGYDPMAFMIEETHKRGMEFHAWLNPYRVTTSGTDLSVLSDKNIAKKNPNWVIEHNNALYLNPALDEVKNYINETVKEIVVNYNVDGIHFDDYFYPSKYPLSEGEHIDGEEANQRRSHVNDLIKSVGETVKNYGNDKVVFGVSPMGVYKDVVTEYYSIKGGQSYYSVFGDSVAWIKNEWIDYITPQVYWQTDHATAAYENVVHWWNSQVEGTGVKLYIGEGIYRDEVAREITKHFEISSKYNNVKGHFFYSTRDLLNNREGVFDAIKNYYSSLNSNGNNQTQTPVPTPQEQTPDPMPQETTPEVPNINIRTVEAIATQSKVLVDGIEKSFESYNIDGYTYFKLRDIAFSINSTGKQFNTTWDESKQAITIATNTGYETVGGEMELSSVLKNKTATTSTATLYVNNVIVECEVYNIDGYNYYKLRDLGKTIDFGITWDEELNTIGIVTLVGY